MFAAAAFVSLCAACEDQTVGLAATTTAVAEDGGAARTDAAVSSSSSSSSKRRTANSGANARDAAAPGDHDDDADGGSTSSPKASDTQASDSKCAAASMPKDCSAPKGRALPNDLRCTGLYSNFTKRELACGVVAYTPAFEQWTDGGSKLRWVALPEGKRIDATDPEGYAFPVGTQLWEELRIDFDDTDTGNDNSKGKLKPAETRYMRKLSEGADGWAYTSYVWDESGKTARQTNDGVRDLFGSGHVVPTLAECKLCHAGRKDFVLGWDPVMLGPGAKGATLEELAERRMIQHQKPAPVIPGFDHDVVALGYLHANCGVSCHNPDGAARDSGLWMRLDTDKLGDLYETPLMATGLYKTPAPGAKIDALAPPQDMPFVDVFLSRPDASLVLARMRERGNDAQMPPLDTRKVDEQGVAAVHALLK